ncbi:MAG: hypothetical protein IRZ04_19215 [Rhodospirillales bacterium]|nr:hypothetical protein [Rhodospirillales bacterium]
MSDSAGKASFPDFRDALREVWPDVREESVARAWARYLARLRTHGGSDEAPPRDALPPPRVADIERAFSRRDLPILDGQAEELAIEILKGWL